MRIDGKEFTKEIKELIKPIKTLKNKMECDICY